MLSTDGKSSIECQLGKFIKINNDENIIELKARVTFETLRFDLPERDETNNEAAVETENPMPVDSPPLNKSEEKAAVEIAIDYLKAVDEPLFNGSEDFNEKSSLEEESANSDAIDRAPSKVRVIPPEAKAELLEALKEIEIVPESQNVADNSSVGKNLESDDDDFDYLPDAATKIIPSKMKYLSMIKQEFFKRVLNIYNPTKNNQNELGNLAARSLWHAMSVS